MLLLDWNNPKITISDLDLFLRSYLKDIFDGIVVDADKIIVNTFGDITADQELYIRNWYYSLNDIPQTVTFASEINNSPFATKTITTTQGVKKLYARIHGIQKDITLGSNTIDFVIPYSWAKITGLIICNCEALDTVDLAVYDTATGTYSSVPNYQLNQFAFSVNLPKDDFSWTSPYDADLYQGMIIRITYNSLSAKRIGVNYILNEVR